MVTRQQEGCWNMCDVTLMSHGITRYDSTSCMTNGPIVLVSEYWNNGLYERRYRASIATYERVLSPT
jgi:hypothetical protein